MLACWVLFPLVLALVSLGCGLLLEIVSGVRLPGAIVPAAGLALVVVATHFTTLTDATAELSVPLVVALATARPRPVVSVAGPWTGRRLGRRRRGRGVRALRRPRGPVGRGDVHRLHQARRHCDLARDHRPDHGARARPRRPRRRPPTRRRSTSTSAAGIRSARFFRSAVGHTLVGQDSAWLFQPYMAFLAALLATTLYTLVRRFWAPARCARSRRPSRARPRSSSVTAFGAGSRRSRRRGPWA